MNIFDNNFKEIISSQLVSVFGGLITGTILAIYTDKILLIPGMLILLPGLLEMRGNISGAFASRLSAGLFLGIVKPKLKRTKLINANLAASFLLAIITSFILGLIAFAFTYFVLGISSTKIIFIPIITATIANIAEIPITLLATLSLFKKGHDPNNIMGPFVTSTGDVTTTLALLLTIAII
ncbi:MAG: magnesium transporter [Nanoarchaeota archaeon]|mgnify:CR=1 FL=1